MRFDGRQLAATRTTQALTQKMLAERAGVSIATIRKLETGGGGASGRVLLAVCRALDVNPEDLYAEEAP